MDRAPGESRMLVTELRVLGMMVFSPVTGNRKSPVQRTTGSLFQTGRTRETWLGAERQIGNEADRIE
jgi:hypothetical protein